MSHGGHGTEGPDRPDAAGPPVPDPPEDSGRAPRGIAGRTGPAQVPVVWGLMVLNVAMLLVLEAAGGSTDIRTQLRLGAQPNPLPSGDLWRLVTAMFLHFGVVHLAVNLWALWIFGPLFEQLAGSGRFLVLYLASGLLGGAATALVAEPGTVAAGASGAIFGLLGAFLVLGWRLRDRPQGRAWLRNALLLIGLNVVLGLSVPSIGLVAHLGGLVGGIVIFGAEPMAALPGVPVPQRARRPRSRMTAVATVVAVASLGAAGLLAPAVPSAGL